MDTSALVAAVCPTINQIGSAFYFAPETVAAGKARGIDGFRLYVLGRGGVLGDAPSHVVSSAFGWWNPETIDKLWTSAKERMSVADGTALYMQCAHDLGTAKFGAVSGVSEWCALAEKITTSIDYAGLSLAAGYAAIPLPDDAGARAMHLLALLREYRGDAHIVAVTAAGLSPRIAHAIRRPDMFKSFGWGEELPEVSDAQLAALSHADQLTDAIVTPAYAALAPTEADRFAELTTVLAAALT